MNNLVLLSLFNVVLAQNFTHIWDSNRKEAQPGELPFVVALVAKTTPQWFCSGSILKPKWIVTSGQCLTKTVPSDVYIVAGLATLPLAEKITHAEKFLTHPDFPEIDLGLIQLKQPLQWSQLIKPVFLGQVGSNERVVTVGWRPNFSGALILVKQVTYDSCSSCQKLTICASNEETEEECLELAGGPLIEAATGHFVGIVTEKRSCGYMYENFLYERAYTHLGWISSTIYEE